MNPVGGASLATETPELMRGGDTNIETLLDQRRWGPRSDLLPQPKPNPNTPPPLTKGDILRDDRIQLEELATVIIKSYQRGYVNKGLLNKFKEVADYAVTYLERYGNEASNKQLRGMDKYELKELYNGLCGLIVTARRIRTETDGQVILNIRTERPLREYLGQVRKELQRRGIPHQKLRRLTLPYDLKEATTNIGGACNNLINAWKHSTKNPLRFRESREYVNFLIALHKGWPLAYMYANEKEMKGMGNRTLRRLYTFVKVTEQSVRRVNETTGNSEDFPQIGKQSDYIGYIEIVGKEAEKRSLIPKNKKIEYEPTNTLKTMMHPN